MLWLRRRPAATALIQPLAQEFPYAAGVALKKKKKKKKRTILIKKGNLFQEWKDEISNVRNVRKSITAIYYIK